MVEAPRPLYPEGRDEVPHPGFPRPLSEVPPPEPRRRRTGRTVLHTALLLAGPLLLLVAGAYFYATGGRFATTEDAYVKAYKIPVSAEVAGRVSEVAVDDNDRVAAGDALFRVDDEPYRIALAHAEANLGAVRTEIAALKAEYREKQAELKRDEQQLAFRTREFERSKRLADRKVVSEARLDAAENAMRVARENVAATRQDIQQALARLGGAPDLPAERHPDFLKAKAERDRAALDLRRTAVRAPAAGIVSRVTIRPGEYVRVGEPVFSLVPVDDIWIEANFKETDLTHVRPGQSATVEVDTYPGREWRAAVASISPASGAEFALLPPQNATGNWVKVVQRIPVRLRLDRYDGEPPLRAGMSVYVRIDTGHRRSLRGLVDAAVARAKDLM